MVLLVNNRSFFLQIRTVAFWIAWFWGTGILAAQTPAADTVSMNLKQAEKLFMEHNLQILAQQLNVDATKALILQAKLYPNPNFNFVQGAYQTETGRWFDVNAASGEEAYQVSQLIVLSHKIKKQVHIATTNYKLAEDNLLDLLRTLRYGLRSCFYNIYYLQQTAKVYDEEITALKTITEAYKKVADKGYVAASEIVQVQAQLYALQSEFQNLNDNINDLQSQLRLLLQMPPDKYILPQFDTNIVDQDPTNLALATLMDTAEKYRTDLMIARDNSLLSQQNYALQKALAIPDVTMGANADRHGSYITDFNSISIGIDIPVFNRNQGNIKNAKILIDYNKTEQALTEKTVTEQVYRGYQKLLDADKLYRNIDKSFSANFEHLANQMLENYRKRNVSLLTFQTFYDAYKQNTVQLNNILFNKVNAMENMNFLTGWDFFNTK
jgi:outer membrane protein, heavy metal efflux system